PRAIREIKIAANTNNATQQTISTISATLSQPTAVPLSSAASTCKCNISRCSCTTPLGDCVTTGSNGGRNTTATTPRDAPLHSCITPSTITPHHGNAKSNDHKTKEMTV